MSFVSGPITFTGTQYTELATYNAAWSKQSGHTVDGILGTGGTYAISAQSTENAAYVHSGTPASADYSVFADIAKLSGNTTPSIGLIGRAASGARTYYWVLYTHSATNIRLFSLVAGSQTQLGSSYTYTLTSTPVRLELRLAGTAISVHLDGGAAVISSTNGDVTAAGKAGITLRDMRETGVADSGSLDNFDAVDAGGGGSSSLPLIGGNSSRLIGGRLVA
jgi:hypothetical protein